MFSPCITTDCSNELYPKFTGSTPPPLIPGGIFVIPNATDVVFTVPFGFSLATPPARVFCQCVKQSNGSNISCDVVRGSITTTGFDIELQAPTGDPSPSIYQVFWQPYPV